MQTALPLPPTNLTAEEKSALRAAADKLRGHIDAATFDQRYEMLTAELGIHVVGG